MDLRTGSRVGERLGPLAGLYARAGLALPPPLELYIRAGNAAVVWVR